MEFRCLTDNFDLLMLIVDLRIHSEFKFQKSFEISKLLANFFKLIFQINAVCEQI